MIRLRDAIEECTEVAAVDLTNMSGVQTTPARCQQSRQVNMFSLSKQQQQSQDNANPISLCSATMSDGTIQSRGGFPLHIDDDNSEISDLSEADTLDNISRPLTACTMDTVPE